MAVRPTAQNGWQLCYDSWPLTHPQTPTMTTSGMWCWLFHSIPVLLPSMVLTYFDAFATNKQKQKKCPVRYGAGSCAMISETETPSLDELSLNHYPENTIRPIGELWADSCVCHTTSSSVLSSPCAPCASRLRVRWDEHLLACQVELP